MTVERRWDVYRDKDGNPVTITPEQCAAISHALNVWESVAKAENYEGLPGITRLRQAFYGAVVSKSCLMGRMLYEGRAPLNEKPPVLAAAPAYFLTDPDLCRYCGGPKDEPGRNLMTSLVPPEKFVSGYAIASGDQPIGKTVTRVQCAEEWHPRS